ncbi:unnamed protein product, partial [Rotaria sp. Silwood2]
DRWNTVTLEDDTKLGVLTYSSLIPVFGPESDDRVGDRCFFDAFGSNIGQVGMEQRVIIPKKYQQWIIRQGKAF